MNNKPNYKDGKTRHTIIQLMLITGLITPKSYKLFNAPERTVNKCIAEMKKEQVIEKSKNGAVFENINISNYRFNYENYFKNVFPKPDLAYFDHTGKRDIRRAKNSKGKNIADAHRVIRNAEIMTIMYAAGIRVLPSEKNYMISRRNIDDSVYFQAREIKTYSGYKDDVIEDESNGQIAVHATRVNGTLLTEGENYMVYHMGKTMKNWTVNGEFKLKNYVSTVLARYDTKGTCEVNSSILFAYDLMMFMKLLEFDKKSNYNIELIGEIYDHVYVLPYDCNGRDMLRLMQDKDWDVSFKEYLYDSPIIEDRNLHIVCDYVDHEVYVFIFCVPDLNRFKSFRRAAMNYNNKSQFQVFCFDFQREFVEASIGEYADILEADFKESFEEYINKQLRPQ